MTSVHVLLNPASGDGAAERRWRRLEPVARSVFPGFELVESRSAGELRTRAAAIAREVRDAVVLAAGGDGTSHEVVNGLLDAGTGHGAAMGWIPLGSGNDLARASGLPLGRPACLEAYRDYRIEPIDVGAIRFRTRDGEPARRSFGNSLTMGLSVDVLELCRRSGKRLGGRIAYSVATVRTLMSQCPPRIDTVVDGRPFTLPECRLLAITNGATVGAGMRIAPDARLDDGRFDIVAVGPLSRIRTLVLFPSIFWGGHLRHPAVSHRRASRIEIAGDGPVAFEADGELVEGRLPVDVDLIPGGLRILRPAGAIGVDSPR